MWCIVLPISLVDFILNYVSDHLIYASARLVTLDVFEPGLCKFSAGSVDTKNNDILVPALALFKTQ